MTNQQLYLGIDCGTQGTKAIILDAVSGQVLGQGAPTHKMISGANGRREQDTAHWLEAFSLATRSALLAADVDGHKPSARCCRASPNTWASILTRWCPAAVATT